LQACQSAHATLFGDDPVNPAHDTAATILFRPGTAAPDHAGCIASHMQLRIATNGYNVSFEKPVVVGHDLAAAVPFGRLLD
jgi:hypothetical protein